MDVSGLPSHRRHRPRGPDGVPLVRGLLRPRRAPVALSRAADARPRSPRSAATGACTRAAGSGIFAASIDLEQLETATRDGGFGALKCRKEPLEHCPSSIDKAYLHRSEALGCVNPEFFEPVGGDAFRVIARLPIQELRTARARPRAAGGPTPGTSRVDGLAVLGRASRAGTAGPAGAGGRGRPRAPRRSAPRRRAHGGRGSSRTASASRSGAARAAGRGRSSRRARRAAPSSPPGR